MSIIEEGSKEENDDFSIVIIEKIDHNNLK